MEELELISRSKDGDLDCFNRLVQLYQKQAYNLALRMLGNVQAAEDATQDAFILAWRGVHGFRGGNFKAWILRIVANACRDQLRRRKRSSTVSLDILLLDPDNLPRSPDSPEGYAMRRELGEEIQKGLASLSPDQRLAVVLRDIQGFSYEEMAQVMGTSLGTVKSRLSRGRVQLRDYLRRRELFSH